MTDQPGWADPAREVPILDAPYWAERSRAYRGLIARRRNTIRLYEQALAERMAGMFWLGAAFVAIKIGVLCTAVAAGTWLTRPWRVVVMSAGLALVLGSLGPLVMGIRAGRRAAPWSRLARAAEVEAARWKAEHNL
jgi:hypothetical protein